MDERKALMAAVVAQPEDDMPRLILADWLEEHGGASDRARAEFIRVQCRRARLAEDDPERAALEAREKELAGRHWRDWLGPLVGFWVLLDTQPDFTRGLLRWWYTTAGRFLKKDHQQAVGAAFPTVGVDELHLTEPTRRAALLVQSAALAWVPRFSWSDARVEDDVFEALASGPHFAKLSSLTIEKPRCTDAGLRALAGSRNLPGLRKFGLRNGLWGGKYTTGGVLRVLNSPRLPLLEELDLSDNQPARWNDRAFFADLGLSRLKRLALGFRSSVSELARCPHLSALERLSVAGTTITDADVEAFVGNPAFRSLRQVTLYNMNSLRPPLAPRSEKALQKRFGDGLFLKYSVLVRQG